MAYVYMGIIIVFLIGIIAIAMTLDKKDKRYGKRIGFLI